MTDQPQELARQLSRLRDQLATVAADQTAIDADEDAFIAAFRDRLDEGLGAYLDQTTDPDDPRNAA